MSMQQGAKTPESLAAIIKGLGWDMQEFSDCENGVKEITITLDEDNTFTITTD